MYPEILIKKYTHILPLKATVVYDTYWKFAVERQNIFFKRILGSTEKLTDDAILQRYKFTNTYRSSDRVSQYLIKNVIYSGDQSPREVFFRIMLFKVFNKIETWELLQEKFGEISWENFDYRTYSNILSDAIQSRSIFSAAYIMPTRSKNFNETKKHNNYLLIIKKMMDDNVPEKICDSKRLLDVFSVLRAYPLIGDFLAFQYAIDINYSEMINFSEMSFVVAGPGAKNGIRKCFCDTGGLSDVDIIKYVADNQEVEFNRLGLDFQNLFGRKLQLIDCQNIFCEVDKYSRVAFPEINFPSGRTRIKQKYRLNKERIYFFYPPKWNINEALQKFIALQKSNH
jgi:hypothetical protein